MEHKTPLYDDTCLDPVDLPCVDLGIALSGNDGPEWVLVCH